MTDAKLDEGGGRGADGDRRYLVFALNRERYALPLPSVREVIALTEITPVPYTPPHFKGIMNLRGQVLSVIDLRLKLRLAEAEITSETAIIILDLAPLSIGVIVDEVDSVLAATATDILTPPEIECTEPGSRAEYITGILRREDKLILLLDISRALDVEDLRALNRSQAAANAA